MSNLPADGTKQALARYSFVQALVSSRAEILSTFLIDGTLVTLAAFARAFFLWLLGLLGGETDSGPIHVLELILDYGFLGTALTITAFDLMKRIRTAYRDFRA